MSDTQSTGSRTTILVVITALGAILVGVTIYLFAGESTSSQTCPAGFFEDTAGTPSPETAGLVPESPAVTDVEKSFNLICSAFSDYPIVLTMVVEGDFESMATTDTNSFFVKFIANNEYPLNVFDEDGFEVIVGWIKTSEVWAGRVSDAEGTRIRDADVDVEMLDASTLQATVDIPGYVGTLRNVRTELSGVTQDANQTITGQYLDIAQSEPAP